MLKEQLMASILIQCRLFKIQYYVQYTICKSFSEHEIKYIYSNSPAQHSSNTCTRVITSIINANNDKIFVVLLCRRDTHALGS